MQLEIYYFYYWGIIVFMLFQLSVLNSLVFRNKCKMFEAYWNSLIGYNYIFINVISFHSKKLSWSITNWKMLKYYSKIVFSYFQKIIAILNIFLSPMQPNVGVRHELNSEYLVNSMRTPHKLYYEYSICHLKDERQAWD